MLTESQHAWVSAIKARGWTNAALTLLDALEPLGALGAQVLFVAQPIAGAFGARESLRALADALETPHGIAALRAALEDEGS
jgi:hypothetical protein